VSPTAPSSSANGDALALFLDVAFNDDGTPNGWPSPFKHDPAYTQFGQVLKKTLTAATQSFALGICTDSTANDTTDWFAQLGNLIATRYPAYAVNFLKWDDTKQDYQAPVVLQASPGAARSVRFVAGNNSNFILAADGAQPTSDIDVAIKVSLDNWTPATNMVLACHFGGAGNRSFRFYVDTAGKLQFETCADGTTLIPHASTVATGIANGATKWVGATLIGDNGAAGHNVKFWTSTDGVIWTQLGATVTTAGVTSLFSSTSQWELASRANTLDTLVGNIFDVRIRNGGEVGSTTATGVNALDAATINVGSTATFPSVGAFMFGTTTITYTGKTATSFTGCSAHAATVGGETLTGTLGPIILPCFPEHWQGPPSGAAGYGTASTTVGSPILNIVDAGAAGFGITYLSNATRVKKMLPDYSLTAVFLSTSHNDSNLVGGNGGGRNKTLVTNWTNWIGSVKTAAYNAVPIICTQNPRLAPAGNIADHAIRREMLLALAGQLGYPALDGYQAFIDTGNVAAYTQADGIHPNTSGTTPRTGMQLWADYAYAGLSLS
jgi:lysophospholipase L1-like esterase